MNMLTTLQVILELKKLQRIGDERSEVSMIQLNRSKEINSRSNVAPKKGNKKRNFDNYTYPEIHSLLTLQKATDTNS